MMIAPRKPRRLRGKGGPGLTKTASGHLLLCATPFFVKEDTVTSLRRLGVYLKPYRRDAILAPAVVALLVFFIRRSWPFFTQVQDNLDHLNTSVKRWTSSPTCAIDPMRRRRTPLGKSPSST